PLLRRHPRLVRLAHHRAHARRDAKHRRGLHSLPGPDLVVPVPADEPLPVLVPRARGRGRTRLRGAAPARATRRAGGDRLTARRWQLLLPLAAVWLIVAWLLLDTTVPDLSLPHIDANSTFGAATVARAVRYERFVRWNWALSQVALLVVLAVYAKKG